MLVVIYEIYFTHTHTHSREFYTCEHKHLQEARPRSLSVSVNSALKANKPRLSQTSARGQTHVVSEHHSQFPDLVLDVNGVQSVNEMCRHTDVGRKDVGEKDRSVWLKEGRSLPWRVFQKGAPGL